MAKNESILTLAMLVVGIFLTIDSLWLGLGTVHRPGVGFLPFYTGLGLTCVTLVSLIKAFLAKTKKQGTESEKMSGRAVLRVVAILVALGIYVFVLPFLGFLTGTFLLLIVLFRVGGFRRWATTLAAGFLSVSISYLLFCSWLGLRFPKGPLGF